jgi:hypothetical protein
MKLTRRDYYRTISLARPEQFYEVNMNIKEAAKVNLPKKYLITGKFNIAFKLQVT